MAPFLALDNLKPYVSDDLSDSTKPIEFQIPSGARAYGYRAELLPTVCDVYLRARESGDLLKSQLKVAQACELIVRGLAHVGIVALVDEATGYQADRARDSLARILERQREVLDGLHFALRAWKVIHSVLIANDNAHRKVIPMPDTTTDLSALATASANLTTAITAAQGAAASVASATSGVATTQAALTSAQAALAQAQSDAQADLAALTAAGQAVTSAVAQLVADSSASSVQPPAPPGAVPIA
jgi:hypothetical protein